MGWGRGEKHSLSDSASHEQLMAVSQDVSVADVFPRLPDSFYLNALCGKDRAVGAARGIYPAGSKCSQDSDGSAPPRLLSRRFSSLKQYSSCFQG